MGRVGKYSISPSAVPRLEGVTELISAISEAAIFFCAGIVAFGAVVSILDRASSTKLFEMISMLVFLYIMIHLVRGFVIVAGHRILMSSKGLFGRSREGASYGMRKEEMWVLFVSGLRGAVGLALASILIQESVTAGGKEDGDDQSKKDMLSVEEELFFYVSGIVVLPLLVNGTLIGVFYNGINVYPEVQLFFLLDV